MNSVLRLPLYLSTLTVILVVTGCQSIQLANPDEDGFSKKDHTVAIDFTSRNAHFCDTTSVTKRRQLIKISQQLEPLLVDQGVVLNQEQSRLLIYLSADRFFLRDSPRLSKKIFPVLDALLSSLSDYPESILGLTINDQNDPNTERSALTSLRAHSIENYFKRHLPPENDQIANTNNKEDLPLANKRIKEEKIQDIKSQIILTLCISKKSG